MSSTSSSKNPLLPIAEPHTPGLQLKVHKSEDTPQELRVAECLLLVSTILLGLFHIVILNLDLAPSTRDTIGASFVPIAEALPRALYVGFPAAGIFFIAAPFIVKRNCIGFARCLVIFCYLFGATWGASFGPSRLN
ncbi:hypothetical protein GQ43DRAFT_56999 [Delitschia confertaspora ATCC 74209]|uniref:Uncharacterized protein n=1 Tax=Delitschia confertaspora ATCC 74209 TaxID=1513339 RepID=A0A9P4MSC5_9PLEO|nr:hypothetical protein GQ43DRAFT_56999 [Delitschia confertaspora ATCC 74209]